MGLYITWSGDVLGRYPELKDLRIATDGGATAADSYCIAPAEAELHGRLAARFSTPFTATNMTARDLAVDLTYLKAVRPDDGGKTDQVRDAVDKRIERLLGGQERMIALDGTSLGGGDGQPVYSPTLTRVPVFDIDSPLEWERDPDQLEDIRVRRIK